MKTNLPLPIAAVFGRLPAGGAGAGPWAAALLALAQVRRYPRHFRNLLLHSTPRRLLNLALVEAEFRLGRTTLRGKPYIAFVDPVNVCNLRCPLCPTGTNDLLRKRGTMPLDEFKHTIDHIAPWAYEVVLYNWGEPLLNKHIFEMIRYARGKNLATSMSSNFTFLPGDGIDNLIRSGLENISISIDGATPETYARYRVGGDFNAVLANLKALIARRRELGSPTPVVEWQFIVMRQNEHEIEQARRLAREVGVDLISFIPVALPYHLTDEGERRALAERWFSSRPEYRYAETATGWTVTKGPWRRWFSWASTYRDLTRSDRAESDENHGRCFYLYRSITVNPGGGVAPCCIVYDETADTGRMGPDGLAGFWNNDRYRSARAEFNRHEAPSLETICTNCHIFPKPRRAVAPSRQSDALIPLETVAAPAHERPGGDRR
jgi:MoaA/NifB/PqqE/SkfB family radical SAM enzyme